MTKKKWKVLKVHFDAPALIEDALNRLDDEGYIPVTINSIRNDTNTANGVLITAKRVCKNTKSERPNILRNKL